jgi:hypothetical protein
MFQNIQPSPTACPGISRLEKIALDLYEFTSPDLRDFWDEPITFYDTRVTLDAGIQLTRDLRIRFVALSHACFFREGAGIVRQSGAAVRARIDPASR